MRNNLHRRDVLKSAIAGPTAWQLLSQSAGTATAASGSDWPQFQYDAANTGYNPDAEGPTGELTERWSFSTLGEVVSSPIVVDDTVYVGSKDGKVYALHAETGDKEWEYDTETDICSSPVSDGTTIYIGNQEGSVFALSLDGIKEWTTSFSGTISAELSLVNGRLFVPVGEVNKVIAVNASNGQEEWRAPGASAKPAVTDGVCYTTRPGYSAVYGYNVSSGDEVWQADSTFHNHKPLTYSTNSIFEGSDYYLKAYGSSDGDDRWEYNKAISSTVAIRNRSAFAFNSWSDGGAVYCVDTVTGKQQWVIELSTPVNSAPVLAGDLIYVGCDDGNVYSLKQSDGSKISSFTTDAAVQSTAAVSSGAVFVGSDDGYVYAIEDLPPNENPTASFNYSPSPVIADREAEFDAADSNDPDGDIESYTWDFDGNGATDARGETVTTTFDSSGEREVTLTVTDNRGTTTSTSQTVSVNQPPEPGFSYSPDTPNVDESVTFDASESSDADGTIDQFSWEFGDEGEATGQQVSHTFTTGGEQTVTLTITDDDGTTRTTTRTVAINRAPTAEFSVTPTQPGIDQTVTFDASESNAPDGSIQSYEWSFNETSETDPTSETITRQYAETGEYTVSLTVTDSNGLTDSVQQTITVNESPATVTPEQPTDGTTESQGSGATTTVTDPSADGPGIDIPDVDAVPVVGALAGGATLLGGGALLARRESVDDSDEGPLDETAGDGSVPTKTLPDPDGELDADFADFERLDLIGKGGSGDVHKARITVDGVDRIVALKTPRVHNYQTIDESFAKEFLTEAETWSGLDDHEHIVDVLDWGHTPQPWIAMEFMDDGSLREHLPLDIGRGIEVLTAVADATQHAHRHGVAHGDLKPENVLFGTADGDSVVKVGDWGLAKVLLDHSESTQGLSPAYAAPEQFAESDRDAKGHQMTDIYQLGALAYAAFTGQPPYEGSPAVIMNQVLNEQPTPPSELNPELPKAVDEFVLQAMSKDPDDRHPTARHFRDELEEVLKSM